MLDLSKFRALQWLIVLLLLVVVELNPTGKGVVSWTPPSDAQWANVRMRSLDLNPMVLTPVVKVTGNETPAWRPRSGHWVFEVQACKQNEDETICSEWIRSDIHGKPEPWVIFWKPPPTKGITVEDANGTR